MDKKKIIIISAAALIVIVAIVGVIAGVNGKADKEDETTKKQQVVEFDNGETSIIDEDVKVDYTSESTADLKETVDFNNETAETEKGHTTENLHATETIPNKEDETTSKIDNGSSEDTDTEKETTSQVMTTSKPITNPTEEQTTTAPVIPAIASGWKQDWVDEYWKEYVPLTANTAMNDEADDPTWSSRLHAICDEYVGTDKWGCEEMQYRLEHVISECTCDWCKDFILFPEEGFTYEEYLFSRYDGIIRGVTHGITMNFFDHVEPDSVYKVYGFREYTVSGYGSEIFDEIYENLNKSSRHYLYLKFYYDSNTNTTTIYAASGVPVSYRKVEVATDLMEQLLNGN